MAMTPKELVIAVEALVMENGYTLDVLTLGDKSCAAAKYEFEAKRAECAEIQPKGPANQSFNLRDLMALGEHGGISIQIVGDVAAVEINPVSNQ